MPTLLQEIKISLLNDLWLPLVVDGGEALYPRRSNNKAMKLFTLTERYHQETDTFEQSNLIVKADIIAWHHSYRIAWVLEADLGRHAKVCHGRFDRALLSPNQDTIDNLNCDIINLDYTSQPENNLDGRVERELNNIAKIISIHRDFVSKGYILLYTTVLDGEPIDVAALSFPYTMPLMAAQTTDADEGKALSVENIVSAVIQGSGYRVAKTDKRLMAYTEGLYVFSVGFLVLRA